MIGGKTWTVGPIFLTNFVTALRSRYGSEFGISLLTPTVTQDIENYAHTVEIDSIVAYHPSQVWSSIQAVGRVASRVLSWDMLIEHNLRQHNIDVVFGSDGIYRLKYISSIFWLPDLQHLHLPKFFSATERAERNKKYTQRVHQADRIMVTGEAVKKDLILLAPQCVEKVRVIRPISYVAPSIYKQCPSKILELYHLPEKFIYLPNQFWKHKNHELVFQAVKLLKEQGSEIYIVCTGNPLDYRDPLYLAELLNKLSQWDIRNQIINLGLIPHEHVLMLMRQCICVLNPSLFEGWGYSVDEARSVGKQLLLSDIPLHQEHDLAKVTYFDPFDCTELADKLKKIWQETRPGPDLELEDAARRTQPFRLHKLAEEFYTLAYESICEKRNSKLR